MSAMAQWASSVCGVFGSRIDPRRCGGSWGCRSSVPVPQTTNSRCRWNRAKADRYSSEQLSTAHQGCSRTYRSCTRISRSRDGLRLVRGRCLPEDLVAQRMARPSADLSSDLSQWPDEGVPTAQWRYAMSKRWSENRVLRSGGVGVPARAQPVLGPRRQCRRRRL
jgi:hypothetical protein